VPKALSQMVGGDVLAIDRGQDPRLGRLVWSRASEERDAGGDDEEGGREESQKVEEAARR